MEEPNEQEGKRQRIPKFLVGFILGFLIVVMYAALLVSVLFPMSCRSRELSRQALCGANLNAIGKGIAIYQSSWSNDLNPPDLATLVQERHTSSGVLVCPSSGTERATTTLPADVESHC